MIEYEIQEIERQLLLVLHTIDLRAASTLLGDRSEYQTETLPRVALRRARENSVGFYPDLISIQISPDTPLEAPIQRFQILKFDEMLGNDKPIVVKKKDEREARMMRVHSVLEEFKRELERAASSAS
jgi:hypothetical protein